MMQVRSPVVRCMVGLIVAVSAATATAGVRQKAKRQAPPEKPPAQSVAQQMPVQAQFAPVQAKTRQSPPQYVQQRQAVPRTQAPVERPQPQEPVRPVVAERTTPPTVTPPVAPRRPALPVSAARVRPAPVRPAPALPAIRYGSSTVTLDNQSGQPALVRLAGPTRSEVHVPAGGRSSIRRVAGGHYTMYTRYGAPGNYRHTRGDSFNVRDGGMGYSHVTITLHTVPAGNYAMHGSSAAEFAAAAP